MEEMRQRIERGDTEREIQETIQVGAINVVGDEQCANSGIHWQAMCDIAKDRAKKLEQSSLNWAYILSLNQ